MGMHRWVILLVVASLSGCTQLGAPPDQPEEVPTYSVPQSLGWEWQQAPHLIRPVAGAACGTIGTDILVVGGLSPAGIVTPQVQRFDSREESWSHDGALPQSLHHATFASGGDRVQIIGGYHDRLGTDLSDVVYERTVLGFWEEVTRLPHPLAEAAFTRLDQTPILVGGTQDGRTASDDIYAFVGNRIVSSWQDIGDLALPRAGSVATPHNATTLVVTGGWQTPTHPVIASHAQTADGEITWDGPDVPTPRIRAASVAMGDLLVMLGGHTADGTVSDAAEFLELSQGVWWSLPPLPVPVTDACAVFLPDGIHIVGGRTQDGDITDAHWVVSSGFKDF